MLSLGCRSSEKENIPERGEQILKEVDYTGPKPDCTAPEIELKQGKLCGVTLDTNTGKKAHAYLGVPFAESTAGKNRWRAPVPDGGWEGTLKASFHGPACPQINLFNPGLPTSEDCLSVSVWTPSESSSEPRPVMIYIYGGTFIFGYNGDPLYDGAHNAANGDVVVVNINYRVGALGFLAGVKDGKTGEEINGNFGILDQALALKWVKDNIHKFGGDPNNITLQGQSAGAASVLIHLTGRDSVKELFGSAIIQSPPIGLPLMTLEESELIAKNFAKDLGCPANDIECLRSKPAQEIVKTQRMQNRVLETALHGLNHFLIWAPVIDGDILKDQIIKLVDEQGINKPLLIGTNKNEAVLFTSISMNQLNLKNLNKEEYSAALDVFFRSADIKNNVLKEYPLQDGNNDMMLSKALTDYIFTCPTLITADNSSHKTWVYQFDHIPSFNILEIINITPCSHAVCHGMELAFVFNTAENTGYNFTQQEKELSDVMGGYWTNFAKQHDPNGNAPKWPEFDSRASNVILVTPIDQIESRRDLKAKCSFWKEIGYNIHTTFWDMF